MKYDSLEFLQKQIDIDSPVAELANQEYEAFIFTSDGRTYQSRKAKKTPLKKGYFLAFGKKTVQILMSLLMQTIQPII